MREPYIGKHRARKHGGPIFVAVYYENGQRKRASLGTDDPQLARTRFAEWEKQRERLSRPERLTIKDIMDGYFADFEAGGRNAGRGRDAWKRLGEDFGPLLPSHVSRQVCQDYARGRRAAPGTVHTELGVLRAGLRWAVKSGWIEHAPHVWMPRKPPPRDRFLTRAEANRLVSRAPLPHVRLFCLLALHTAGRASALLELKWDRVDLKRRLLDLNPDGRTQTRKGRAVVPINDTLQAALEEAKKGALSKHVIEWAGERVASVKKGFAAAVKRAKIAKCSPHDLRRTAARWMAEAGVPMPEISAYLSHTDSRITERYYARFSPTYLMRAASTLG